MDKYSHRERLEMIFAGERPDRFAASFWRHFFHKEHYAEGTAEAMIEFQKRFDWDFVKINPRADYHTQGWGLHLEYSHDEFKKHVKSNFPVKTVDDWRNIEPLSLRMPVLAEHLEVISMIRKGLGRDIPILMTVFTPLSVAGRLVGNDDVMIQHLREAPDKVEQALRAITETFIPFATEARNAGADGLFYATTHWASSDKLTWEEYERFGIPYDLPVIQATEEDAINLFHVCEHNNYLKELAPFDYLSAMYNWDSQDPTNLPIERALDLLDNRTIVGGVDHEGWLRHGSAEEVGYKIDELKEKYDPSRVILGPGCAIPPETPMENLEAIRKRL